MTDSERDLDGLSAELRAAWLSESVNAPTGEEVLMDVRRRAESLNRKIFRRDLVETAATVLAWSVFALMAVLAPGIAPKLGLLVGTGFLVWPVVKLHRERRRHRDSAPDAPIAQHLELELKRVQGQIDLLRSVATWYVTPLAVGATIIMAGLAAAVPVPGTISWRLLIVAGAVVFSAALFVLVGFVVVRINREAVKQQLAPLRDDLLAARESMST